MTAKDPLIPVALLLRGRCGGVGLPAKSVYHMSDKSLSSEFPGLLYEMGLKIEE